MITATVILRISTIIIIQLRRRPHHHHAYSKKQIIMIKCVHFYQIQMRQTIHQMNGKIISQVIKYLNKRCIFNTVKG